jgi:hypothetical protein
MSRPAIQLPTQSLDHSGNHPGDDSPNGSLVEYQSANLGDLSFALAFGLRCILLRN